MEGETNILKIKKGGLGSNPNMISEPVLHLVSYISDKTKEKIIEEGRQEANSEIKELENKVKVFEENSILDPIIPELFNKKHFNDTLALMDAEKLQPTIEKRVKTNTLIPNCVIVFDIDNFKIFNDTYGHPYGDKVIRSVGVVIKNSIRPTDMAFRIGGDEFAIILKNIYSDNIPEIIKNRIQLDCSKISIDETKKNIGVTAGIALNDSGINESYVETFKRADANLVEIKKKNKVGR